MRTTGETQSEDQREIMWMWNVLFENSFHSPLLQLLLMQEREACASEREKWTERRRKEVERLEQKHGYNLGHTHGM